MAFQLSPSSILMSNLFESPEVKALVRIAVDEDLPDGDITSNLTIPSDHSSYAEVYAKSDFIVCGLPIIFLIFETMGKGVDIKILKTEGEKVKPKDVLVKIEGATIDLLSAERIILNFIYHLSSVATFARQTIEQVKGISVLDTRKTTPGFRALEKYAVKVGGADNHRASLSDMILIKNNHIDANNGDVRLAVAKAMKGRPEGIKIEVEVRNIKELKEALEFKPDWLMLDNMSDNEILDAMKIIKSQTTPPRVEVSGGIGKDRAEALSRFGIDAVSMGALTKRGADLDLSMRIVSVS